MAMTNMAPAGQGSAAAEQPRRPFLFRHLAALSSEADRVKERERATFVFKVFFVFMLLAPLLLFLCWHSESIDYETVVYQLRNELQGLEAVMAYSEYPKLADRYDASLNRLAGQIFSFLHGVKPEASDGDAVQALRIKLEEVGRDPTGKRLKEFRETQEAHIKQRFPLVRYSRAVWTWLAFGVLYFLAILIGYGFFWRPSRTEPILNILDIGFIAVLVEYAGGFSIFLILFLFSLFLSAADFTHQEQSTELTDFEKASQKRRLLVFVWPYAIAFLITVFWSVSDGLLLNDEPISLYFLKWLILLIAATGMWSFFYVGIKHHWRLSAIRASLRSPA